MVVAYLEKIRDGFLMKKTDLECELTNLSLEQKENIEFIKFLEVKEDPTFESFTPREVNSYHKKKIKELKIELEKTRTRIEELHNEIDTVIKKITEINDVIQTAKKLECTEK